MLAFGRAQAKTRLPFGLFLGTGALLTLFLGSRWLGRLFTT
jgi:prepilin signal peptidase PulO-like enzyme (type II secretory pathway)